MHSGADVDRLGTAGGPTAVLQSSLNSCALGRSPFHSPDSGTAGTAVIRSTGALLTEAPPTAGNGADVARHWVTGNRLQWLERRCRATPRRRPRHGLEHPVNRGVAH